MSTYITVVTNFQKTVRFLAHPVQWKIASKYIQVKPAAERLCHGEH